jgi:hypothetical protein
MPIKAITQQLHVTTSQMDASITPTASRKIDQQSDAASQQSPSSRITFIHFQLCGNRTRVVSSKTAACCSAIALRVDTTSGPFATPGNSKCSWHLFSADKYGYTFFIFNSDPV